MPKKIDNLTFSGIKKSESDRVFISNTSKQVAFTGVSEPVCRKNPLFGIEAVIFDLDGVISKTNEFQYKSWDVLADNLGVKNLDSIHNKECNPIRGHGREVWVKFILDKGAKSRTMGTEKWIEKLLNGEAKGKRDKAVMEWVGKLLEKTAKKEGKDVEQLRKELMQDRYSYRRFIEILGQEKEDISIELVKNNDIEIYPGVEKLIQNLSERGFKLGVASGSAYAREVLEKTGLDKYFGNNVVDARKYKDGKADINMLAGLASTLKVSPHNCVIIEDGQMGIDKAKELRMKAIGIGNNLTKTDLNFDSIDKIDPNYHIQSRDKVHVSRYSQLPIKNVKAVIFDLDGVVTDTNHLHYIGWNMLADKQFHINLDSENDPECRDLMGASRDTWVRMLIRRSEEKKKPEMGVNYKETVYSKEDIETLGELKDKYCIEYVEKAKEGEIEFFSGIKELLQNLKEIGIRIAIASGSFHSKEVLEKVGLYDSFDCVLDSNKYPNGKSDTKMLEEAARSLGMKPKDYKYCVLIEDGKTGIKTAKKLNMKTIAIGPDVIEITEKRTTKAGTTEEKVIRPDLAFNSISEIDLNYHIQPYAKC